MGSDKTQLEDRTTPFRVSAKPAFVFATTIITVLGTVAVAYISNPPDKPHDYGSDVKAIQQQLTKNAKRIDDLVAADIEHEHEHDAIDLQLQRMETEDVACRERADRVELKIDNHLEVSGRKVNEYERAFERYKVLIEECMRRTRP